MPAFKGTTQKIETMAQCVEDLTEAWANYQEKRLVYAETLLHFNWTHHGGKNDANPHRRTEKMSAAYDDYFEALDTYKRAHAVYRTAYRNMDRGHLL